MPSQRSSNASTLISVRDRNTFILNDGGSILSALPNIPILYQGFNGFISPLSFSPLCRTISFGVNLSVVGFHIYEQAPNLLNSFRLLSLGVYGSPVIFQPFVSKEYSAKYLSVASLISNAFCNENVEVNISSTYFLINSLNTSCSIPAHFIFFNSCVVSCTNTFDTNSVVESVLQLTSQNFIELPTIFSEMFLGCPLVSTVNPEFAAVLNFCSEVMSLSILGCWGAWYSWGE